MAIVGSVLCHEQFVRYLISMMMYKKIFCALLCLCPGLSWGIEVSARDLNTSSQSKLDLKLNRLEIILAKNNNTIDKMNICHQKIMFYNLSHAEADADGCYKKKSQGIQIGRVNRGTRTVTFPIPYDVAPEIIMSVGHLYRSESGSGTGHVSRLKVLEVTTTYFTFSTSGTRDSLHEIQWLAVPKS